jgi:hypothetical protein
MEKMTPAYDLEAELQRIYDSEINLEFAWFWDGGFSCFAQRSSSAGVRC